MVTGAPVFSDKAPHPLDTVEKVRDEIALATELAIDGQGLRPVRRRRKFVHLRC